MRRLSSRLLLGSHNRVEIGGLVDQSDGQFENGATVVVETITDQETDAEITGVTFPIPMNYVAGSDGQYVGLIADTANLTEGTWYDVKIKAEANGLVRRWLEPALAQWGTD